MWVFLKSLVHLGHNFIGFVLVLEMNLLLNSLKFVEDIKLWLMLSPKSWIYLVISSNDNSTLYFLFLKNCFKGYESN